MKAVIFDFDDVICHTDKYHYKSWKIICKQENIYFDKTINDKLRGCSRMKSLNIILQKATRQYSEDEKQALAIRKNDIYLDFINKFTLKDIDTYALKTIEKLKENNIKVAIGSSSRNAKIILKKLGLFDLFDVVVDGTDTKKFKPDPEVFLLAGAKLHLKTEQCYIVDDAISGIKAGHDGGFKTIAISDAKASDLADYKINNLGEILSLFSLTY